MSRLLKWSRSVCVLLALFLVPMISVPFLGTMWHLGYGDFISYRRWRVRVPPAFYVRQGEHGPSFWKLPLGFPLWHDPYAVISISEIPHPFKYEEDYQNFMTGAEATAQDEGLKFIADKEVSNNKTTGHCLEYGLLHNTSKSYVQCTVENANLLFAYRGHAKYIPILFSTLQSLSNQDDFDRNK